jgi:hypothetical protein
MYASCECYFPRHPKILIAIPLLSQHRRDDGGIFPPHCAFLFRQFNPSEINESMRAVDQRSWFFGDQRTGYDVGPYVFGFLAVVLSIHTLGPH